MSTLTTSEKTVAQLVSEKPGRSRVFQKLNIDFCCKGGRTLTAMCAEKGLALTEVVALLEAEDARGGAETGNPALLEPAQLTRYIVVTFHDPIRAEAPRLRMMAERVAKVHGDDHPEMIAVRDELAALSAELDSHMMKEEVVLFPAICELFSGAGAANAPVNCAIRQMRHEHDDAGASLERLEKLTNGFTPPPGACNTFMALIDGLREFRDAMYRHVHLENHVLFPRVEAHPAVLAMGAA
jgi:regulator of cell morphogenesis and NO signaling